LRNGQLDQFHRFRTTGLLNLYGFHERLDATLATKILRAWRP
jgi:hypothetical protein